MPIYCNVKDTVTCTKEEMLQMTKIEKSPNRQKMMNRQLEHTPYVRPPIDAVHVVRNESDLKSSLRTN